MNELTNYEYYRNLYQGKAIPQELFENYNVSAASRINYFTSYRITQEILDKFSNQVQNCVCEIMDLLFYQDKLKTSIDDTKNIQSETVGSHSVTYNNTSNLKSQRILNSNELDKECYNICLRHLGMTGLLYRGL